MFYVRHSENSFNNSYKNADILSRNIVKDYNNFTTNNTEIVVTVTYEKDEDFKDTQIPSIATDGNNNTYYPIYTDDLNDKFLKTDIYTITTNDGGNKVLKKHTIDSFEKIIIDTNNASNPNTEKIIKINYNDGGNLDIKNNTIIFINRTLHQDIITNHGGNKQTKRKRYKHRKSKRVFYQKNPKTK